MGNSSNPRIKRIISLTEGLPLFSLDDLAPIEQDKNYLKTLLRRYEARGKLVRLKKGIYTTQSYLDGLEKTGRLSAYLEFLAGRLYPTSYLSLEYVLYEHGLLTEVPVNYTLVSNRKTAHFANPLGKFFYHQIRKELFKGFDTIRKFDFIIFKATAAKALFDFLYLRRNRLDSREEIGELRLNLDQLKKGDLKELRSCFKLEGSVKMAGILKQLFE